MADASPSAAPPSPAFASLIPRPLSVVPGRGAFELDRTTRIVVKGPPEALPVARALATALRPATGLSLRVTRAGDAGGGDIELVLGETDRSLGDEGYLLEIDPGAVRLSARRPAGLFWGVQTLRQLLPAAIEATTIAPGPWRLRAGVVRDRPRFAWRGAMLDVARHFLDVTEVERYIDLIARYKLNRLHLHLTDDQGWRLAIRSWPKLTTYGGQTQVGKRPGGYYTQRQFAEIVAYARRRFVTVVPEIDLPGHTNAALASYAALNCDGKARERYTGIEVGFSSLCIRKELTYRFVDDVVREVAALTAGSYVHIGGDEALSTDPADYLYFLRRIQKIVRAHGKRMIGWEEIGRGALDRSAVVQHWQKPERAVQAVSRGSKVILSPATRVYLDMKYTPETKLGLSWAGTTSVRDAYSWDPATLVDGITETDVLGVESPLWTETVTTFADVEQLAFPRLLGHAEIGWSPAEGRTWRQYRLRLATQGPRLDALGVHYYASPEVPWPTR